MSLSKLMQIFGVYKAVKPLVLSLTKAASVDKLIIQYNDRNFVKVFGSSP